jgi:hypothetical protein
MKRFAGLCHLFFVIVGQNRRQTKRCVQQMFPITDVHIPAFSQTGLQHRTAFVAATMTPPNPRMFARPAW